MKTKEIVPVQNQFTSSYFEITASPKKYTTQMKIKSILKELEHIFSWRKIYY